MLLVAPHRGVPRLRSTSPSLLRSLGILPDDLLVTANWPSRLRLYPPFVVPLINRTGVRKATFPEERPCHGDLCTATRRMGDERQEAGLAESANLLAVRLGYGCSLLAVHVTSRGQTLRASVPLFPRRKAATNTGSSHGPGLR